MVKNISVEKEIEQIKIRLKKLEHFFSDHPIASFSGDDDMLLDEATKIVRKYDRASASLLQRRLSIGYARAARILDQLEEKGVVGPSEGANAREVLQHS